MPDTWPPTVPLDVELAAGDAAIAIDLRGGSLRRLTVGNWEVLDGYPAGGVASGRRGAVLLPWPNRIREGRWTWEGSRLQLEVQSPDAPHAAHGLVSWQPWAVLSATADTATVGTAVLPRPGYPFRLTAAMDVVLTPGRLTTTLRVRNDGDRAAPFGAGFHPYLSVGATAEGGIGDADLHLPARTELALDGGLLPTGNGSRSTARSAGSGSAHSTFRSPISPGTTTAGPASGCAARQGSWSSPSTRPGPGCRCTAGTRSRRASGGAASRWSR